MEALVSILGNQLAWIGGGVLAAILILWRAVAGIKQAGVDQQKAKEAKAREQNLDRIRRAADAKPDGLPEHDPRNRDR